jgi:hypothetical protein
MFVDGMMAPAARAAAVAPHDSNPLAEPARALFVGTGGDIVACGVSGGDAVFKNVPDGTVLPFRAQFVRATGTTATDILALF